MLIWLKSGRNPQRCECKRVALQVFGGKVSRLQVSCKTCRLYSTAGAGISAPVLMIYIMRIGTEGIQ